MGRKSPSILIRPLLLAIAAAPGCTPEECLSQDLAANELDSTEVDAVLACMSPTFEAVVSGLERCQRNPETGETMGTIVVYNDQVCVERSIIEGSTCPDAEENAAGAMGYLIEERGDAAHPNLFYKYSGEGYYIENGEQACGGWVAVAGYDGYEELEEQGLATIQIAFEACAEHGGRSFEAIAGLEEQAGGSCTTWED